MKLHHWLASNRLLPCMYSCFKINLDDLWRATQILNKGSKSQYLWLYVTFCPMHNNKVFRHNRRLYCIASYCIVWNMIYNTGNYTVSSPLTNKWWVLFQCRRHRDRNNYQTWRYIWLNELVKEKLRAGILPDKIHTINIYYWVVIDLEGSQRQRSWRTTQLD